MISDWEKQILAYCIRISRGQVLRGNIKLSLFDEQESTFLGGINIYQFLDIISYVQRLEENLKDPIRRRGLRYDLEIGKRAQSIVDNSGYSLLNLLNQRAYVVHDGFPNEVKFSFSYEPHTAPVIIFEDVEVVEMDSDYEKSLDAEEVNLEAMIRDKFIQEYNFIDDSIEVLEIAPHGEDHKVLKLADNEMVTDKNKKIV